MAAQPKEIRDAKAKLRERERAVWSDVEKMGRDLRAGASAKQTVTQVEQDVARNRPHQGQGF